jgi:hypothetical protein
VAIKSPNFGSRNSNDQCVNCQVRLLLNCILYGIYHNGLVSNPEYPDHFAILFFYSSAGVSLTSALSASVSANSASDAETEGSSRACSSASFLAVRFW